MIRKLKTVFRKARDSAIQYRLNNHIIHNADLDEMCKEEYIYSPREKVCISSANYGQQGNFNYNYTSPKLKVFEVDNCWITSNGLVISQQQEKIILESTRSNQKRLKNFIVREFRNKLDRIDFFTDPIDSMIGNKSRCSTFDLVFPLIPFDQFISNYYHWTLEVIPQIRGLEEYAVQTGQKPLVLLPPDPPNFVIESMSAAGLQSGSWKTMPTKLAHANKLILPESRYIVGGELTLTQSELKWVNNTYKNNLEQVNKSFSTHIYISRENSEIRQVDNEKEVVDKLKQYSFEKQKLEEHTLAEQVKMFNDAKCVVGPHGAGFVNTIFSNNIKILEFLHKPKAGHFLRTSEMLGHEYDNMFLSENEVIKRDRYDYDYIININKLEKKLTDMGITDFN